MAVRTEVHGTVAYDVPCFENAGKVFVGHTNGRIGLVVLQQHVVMRFIAFDKVVFQ